MIPESTKTQKFYKRAIEIAKNKNAIWLLAVFSFCESFIIPIPPDILMIPMMIAKKSKCFFIAFIATMSSFFGGFVGYVIGKLLFTTLGVMLLNIYGSANSLENLKEIFDDYGFWIIVSNGILPLPFKVVAIAAGVVKYNILKFAIAAIISRFIRFFIPACLIYFFKEKAEILFLKHKKIGFCLFAVIAILIIWAIVK